MKYLIFLAILIFSQVVYGQQQNRDLIVTTTGDSLFCKIIDVSPSEIQFSFDRSGGVITLRRSEIISHNYNYRPASGTRSSADRRNDEVSSEFNVAFFTGVNNFGTISVGEDISGGAFVVGGDVIYFFKPYLGAGLKFKTSVCDINFSDFFKASDRIMFIGPALYSSFGNGNLTFGLNASVGGLIWKLSDVNINGDKSDDESVTTLGGILSVGLNYMVTQTFGLGVNVQSVLGSIKTDNYERTPAPIGVAFEVKLKF